MKAIELQNKIKQLKLLALDVDGVLTNGCLWFGANGEEYKCFHVHDGLGLKRLQKSGVTIAIISSRNSPALQKRLQELSIQHIYLGVDNKMDALQDLLQKLQLQLSETAYAGDDLPDLPVMQRVGLSIAVNNAVDEVKQIADWHTRKNGGEGAVREICDFIYLSRA